jgi:hypothetical protein
MLPASRHRRHISWLGAVLVIVAHTMTVRAATLIDPALRFRTLTTTHFRIYFHQGEARMAARLADIAEDVWPKVGGAIGVRAPRRTHVILADQSELANGWATPLPYDTIFITATAPAGSEFIGRNDDWLRLVFTHEFTHIVHLDRSEGWARVFRGVFGRTPIAFPNLWLPTWMIEGLAEWEESALTGDGRLHAGDFRAVELEAGRAHRVEPIDRVNGGLTDWPAGNGAYAFGLGFHQFLADRYGESRFAELADLTARTPPFVGATAFDRVYGRTLDALWHDYTEDLESRAAAMSKTGVVSGPAPTRVTRHGHVVLGPRFAPPPCAGCPAEIIYSTQNPDGLPSLRSVRVNGSAPRELTTRYLGSTAAVTARDVVFDQQELRRNVSLYSDLYILDRATGAVSALTRDARLRDPDLSPNGRTIVCVREGRGQRDLVLVPLTDGRAGVITTLVAEAGTHFDAPRWSPDGHLIAVARHRLGRQSEIVLVDSVTGAVRVLATAGSARIVTPTWRPDGAAVIAAADYDEETFNLYEYRLAPGTAPRQLTATTGGATWPDISPDGRTLVFVGYTADGFDLFTLPYPSDPVERTGAGTDTEMAAPSRVEPPQAQTTEHGYSPWPTLAPTSWFPILENDDQLRAGFSTTGTDVLGRHAYTLGATWLLRPPDDAHAPGAGTPDWDASYVYDRWRVSLFASASSQTLFYAGLADPDGRPSDVTLREREVEAGVFLPLTHVRTSHRAVASLVRTFDREMFPTDVPSVNRTATRIGWSTTTAHVFGYSISPERGVTGGGTAEFVSRALGSTSSATTLTGDVRAYLPGLAEHHVVALRAAGGTTSGETTFGRTFLLGGGAGSADVLDFGREAFSLMRGFPADSFAGSHVALLDADYRFPIARPQRGVGTWPIFLHTIHGAIVSDIGTAWTQAARARDLKTSLGGELAFDIVTGYSFPATVAFGAAWGHDRTDASNRATAYVRIGRAF